MLFETKNEKIEKLDKKVYDIEKRMEQNFGRMNETIRTLNEIILKLQTENTRLRSEKDFLIERHKKMLKRIPVPDLAGEIRERLVKPAAGMIKENSDFIQLLAKEGFVELKEPAAPKKQIHKDPAKELKDHIIDNPFPSHGKSIDKLFELISEAGHIRTDEAARKLKVHELQIEEWGKILEDHDLVTLKKSSAGKMELVKI